VLVNAGPDQLYVAPVTVDAAKLIAEPAQTGLLLVAVGVVGIAFTTTATVPAALVHPLTVAVTLYVPAIDAVAPALEGF
jgi:hypothetical protein